MNRSFLAMTAGVVLALPAAAAVTAADDETSDFSTANQILFMQVHITGPDDPMVYKYELDKTATLEEESDFHDEITMTARPTGDNDAKSVSIDYLSGDRDKFVREVAHATGNPIVMVFLQRDVNEMGRITGGHWRYFQKQIKLGLENKATVEPVTIEYNGKQVEAKRITLKPFTDDSRDEMKDYTGKRYEFTVSDAVPGAIYEMHSILPGKGEDAKPRIEETLVLKSVNRASKNASAQ